MDRLKQFPLVYLGTPYSKYPNGIEAAFQDASWLAAQMLQAGVNVYCPIAHTHPLAIFGKLDPMDLNIWLPFDQAMMNACSAMVIGKMDGWQQSTGVKHEILYFRDAGKPLFSLDPFGLKVEPVYVKP